MRQIFGALTFEGFAPGGEIPTNEQMTTKKITIHTSGKRWYVNYYSKDISGKETRHRVYGRVNVEKDPEKRMLLLLELQTQVYHSVIANEEYSEQLYTQGTNIYKTITQIVSEKKGYLKDSSYDSIQKHAKLFKEWLLKNNLEGKQPGEINRANIITYRNWLLEKKLSNRSVNNNIDEVRAFFNYMIKREDGMVYKNPCATIEDLPFQSETHVAYTDTEMQTIFDYLKEQDPYMLFYIKFVAFAYLRTNEVRLLQIKHIDVPGKTILLTANNNKVNNRIKKVIQNNFMDEFITRKIADYPKDFYVFSIGGKPGSKPVGEGYFSKRYQAVKKKFKLTPLHTIYGFRHTTISQLLRSGVPTYQAMKLTGHTTHAAFEKYARSIYLEPAEDVSQFYSVKF
ncbi:MAG: hypothetical protein A3F72_02845 [Bacteroidetes bacterium RIFCSPLOWO2_12_FULL_35_15]|nr:MAG: hypothetical protein A3F72_02845 [Bacteroidetes bacterium RIFCSPLOWO2_12_FULL_35_15]